MSNTEGLIFSINGSLIPPSGDIPNFQRPSPAFAEFTQNGSTSLVYHKPHVPRWANDGSFILEATATNFLPDSLDLTRPGWVKGSSITVFPNRIRGMSKTFEADRITVSASTGNDAAQTLYYGMTFDSGGTYTVTWYLRLMSGVFGAGDKIGVRGGVFDQAAVSEGDTNVSQDITTPLAPIYNTNQEKIIPISITFTTVGENVNLEETSNEEFIARSVEFYLFCERAVSVDFCGVQVEEGQERTSFIATNGMSSVREGDYLAYQNSPFTNLDTFTFYGSLSDWRGSTFILQAGNIIVSLGKPTEDYEGTEVSIDTADSSLVIALGEIDVFDSDPFPNPGSFAISVNNSTQQARLYVNGWLKAVASVSGFVADDSEITFVSDTMMRLSCFYVFNRALKDGNISIGEMAEDEIGDLFEEDALFVPPSEGHGVISFPQVRLAPEESTLIRYPQQIMSAQQILTKSAGAGAIAQVTEVQVNTIINPSASQVDYVQINNTRFEFKSDATPTATEIVTGLAAAINDGDEPVVASVDGAILSVTSLLAGNPFEIYTSRTLSSATVTASKGDNNTITVSNAVDYSDGRVLFTRDYKFICEAVILGINNTTNVITIATEPNSKFAELEVGDLVVQPSWSTLIGVDNVLVDHLENNPDIKIVGKWNDGFALQNTNRDMNHPVTPIAQVFL